MFSESWMFFNKLERKTKGLIFYFYYYNGRTILTSLLNNF